MLKNRLFFIIVIIIFSVLLYLKLPSNNLNDLYYGVGFDESVLYYFFNMAIYACYCFLVFTKLEDFHSYGELLVTRYMSREKLLRTFFLSLFKEIIFLEMIKIFTYCTMILIFKKTVSLDIDRLLINIFLYLSVVIIFSILQIIIGFILGDYLGLIFNITGYLFFSYIGQFFYKYYSSQYINLGVEINKYILINYTMNSRIMEMINVLHITYFSIFITLIFLVIVVYRVMLRLYLKKDLI